ncbi:unnamed protein product, partial [Prorocentrum cordatum]
MIDYVLRPAGSRRERGRDHRDPIAGLRCAGHDRRSGPRGAQKEKKRRDENEDEGRGRWLVRASAKPNKGPAACDRRQNQHTASCRGARDRHTSSTMILSVPTMVMWSIGASASDQRHHHPWSGSAPAPHSARASTSKAERGNYSTGAHRRRAGCSRRRHGAGTEGALHVSRAPLTP